MNIIPLVLSAQSADQDPPEFANYEVEPTVIFKPEMEFPSIAAQASIVGDVYLKVAIDTTGKPYKASILKRSPEFVTLFDEVARRGAMKYRFTPARDSTGRAIPVWISIPFRFRLRDFEPPECVLQAPPEYPKDALEMGLEGWVGVAVMVDDVGRPIRGNIRVVSREPAYTDVFDDAAVEAAWQCKFKPAVFNGMSTKSWALIKVPFIIKRK